MELKKPAVAGTLESSDVQITLRPNPGGGIELQVQSVVMALFGDSIRQTVRDTLSQYEITDALVEVNDKGALDFVLRSRLQCAIFRGALLPYDWGREDANG